MDDATKYANTILRPEYLAICYLTQGIRIQINIKQRQCQNTLKYNQNNKFHSNR